MPDIWNPWYGCVKCSEGCEHCYRYFLDRVRDRNGVDIYKTNGARPCHFDWVKNLRSECVSHNITFCFIETGSVLVKDGLYESGCKTEIMLQVY